MEEVRTSRKNKFKPVAIIFIILSILLAASAGFFVWKYFDQTTQIDNQKTQLDNLTSELNTTKADFESYKTANPELNEEYLEIKEWGIKFKVPEGLKNNVVYQITEYGNAGLSTKSLTGLDNHCSASNAALGGVSRYAENEYWSAEYRSERINRSPIAGYYYTFSFGGGICSWDDNSATNDLQSSQLQKINVMIDTLQVI